MTDKTKRNDKIAAIRQRLLGTGSPPQSIESMTDWYAVDVRVLLDEIDDLRERMQRMAINVARLRAYEELDAAGGMSHD